MNPIREILRARFYINKTQKTWETFIFVYKSHNFFENKVNLCYVFIHKKPHTLLYAIFHEIFEIGIHIYTKSITLFVT